MQFAVHPPGTVFVWHANTGLASGVLLTVLSDNEQERASRYLRVQDRLRFQCGRAILRFLLGRYVGHPPELFQFGQNEHGKPLLVNPVGSSISFSVAHSGDLILVAIAGGEAVGVDIEHLGLDRNLKIIESSLAGYGPTVQPAPDLPRARGWLQAWTRFEAVGKALGFGIAVGKEEFARAMSGNLTVTDLDIASDYVAAVAIASPQPGIQLCDFAEIFPDGFRAMTPQ